MLFLVPGVFSYGGGDDGGGGGGGGGGDAVTTHQPAPVGVRGGNRWYGTVHTTNRFGCTGMLQLILSWTAGGR